MSKHIMVDDCKLIPVVSGSLTTGIVPTTYVRCGGFETAVILLFPSAVQTALNANLEQAKDAAGTDHKPITGATLATALDGDDVTAGIGAAIEVDLTKMDINDGFDYVSVGVTATGTCTGSIWLLLCNARHRPVTQLATLVSKVLTPGA